MPQPQPQIQPMQPPSPEVIAQLVANQTKDLELRQKQIEVAEHNDERQFTFANKQLEAQERDRQDDRRSNDARFKYGLLATIFVVIVVCVFFAYCIKEGKPELVVELFKVLCYGGAFGSGGFAWGKYSSKTESEKK